MSRARALALVVASLVAPLAAGVSLGALVPVEWLPLAALVGPVSLAAVVGVGLYLILRAIEAP